MEINNLEKIKGLLSFDKEGDLFYFAQLIKRRKDQSEAEKQLMRSDNTIVKCYYITSLDYLERKWNEMVTLCNLFNCRLYINLNPCSFEKNCLHALKEVSDMLINKNHRAIISLPSTLAGKYSAAGSNKTWLVDIDAKDLSFVDTIKQFINTECRPEGDKDVALLDTKMGYHLITKPFDCQKFHQVYPQINVHKNNPTLLYYCYE